MESYIVNEFNQLKKVVMGRYYSGDIEGKFMFAVQPSDAADRFGSTGERPEELGYYFNKEDHMETILEELDSLKENYEKVAKFFEEKDFYTKDDLKDAGISDTEMSDYADYNLGMNIKEGLEEQGEIYFTAEC